MTTSREERARKIREVLANCSCTEQYYLTMNRMVVYTDGVRLLAREGEAYWLLDAIVSYYGSDQMRIAMEADPRLNERHFWRLGLTGPRKTAAMLTASADKNCQPFIKQHIPYTDFPLDAVRVWSSWDGIRWVLYLPSEH